MGSNLFDTGLWPFNRIRKLMEKLHSSLETEIDIVDLLF